jgi:hypothetical protein
MSATTGTNTTRLLGTTPNNVPEPMIRSTSGTPVPVWTDCSCQTFASPSTTKLMPSVTISGCARKMPTPIPVISPASTAAVSDTTTPWTTPPGLLMSVAVTNPTIEATAPTDRSIPPVSIVSVWQPARIASGMAVLMITLAQDGETMPGDARPITRTRIASRTSRGTTGRSRNTAPMAPMPDGL